MTQSLHYKGARVCRNTEQKRFHNTVLKELTDSIERTLTGADSRQWNDLLRRMTEVGGRWTSDQVTAGGGTQPLSASDSRNLAGTNRRDASYLNGRECTILIMSTANALDRKLAASSDTNFRH